MALKETYLVKKRNILNEIRSNNMTLQELRFFSIYLAKINPRDVNTRLVRFSLEDFQKIMELDKPKIQYFKNIANNLLSKVISIPKDNGGFIAFQLFKECVLDNDDNNEWYIEIDAHDKVLPLMFEFKEKYFSYQLWNALRLKSSNQLRMYEILKQYEKIGERLLGVEELKELLGISKNEYKRFGDLKIDVLEVCKKALEESTDIKFTYEPTGKKGRGGKILTLKFKIYKNENYADPLSLNDFIENQNIIDVDEIASTDDKPNKKYQERINFISEACNNEFSYAEMELLYNIIMDKFDHSLTRNELELYHYVQRQYSELKMRNEKTKIKYRFAYLKKIIETSDDF